MKNQIKISRIFLEKKELIRDQLIRLDKPKDLSSLLFRFAHKIVSLSLRTNKKITSRIRLYHKFGQYLLVMNRRHGSTYVVKYLKACSLALSKVIAGQKFNSLRDIEPDLPLPRLAKCGLPVIIGTKDRRSIVQGSHRVIRLYLSLFNLYRVIAIESKSKLNTITDSYAGNEVFLKLFGSWLNMNTQAVIGRFKSRRSLAANHFLFRETASVTCSKSGSGAVIDAALIYHKKEMLSHFSSYCKETRSTILADIVKIGEIVSPSDITSCFDSIIKKSFISFHKDKVEDIPLGQLSTKVEAAGKLRVFAIVDSGTQSLLSPLHRALFDILKKIPNDGTFDQDAAFKRATIKATANNCCYGYDLSAATDRLPIYLQVEILASIYGRRLAVAGSHILIDRDYYLFSNSNNLKSGAYRYAVGQPMGALSSGAMLAISHHMIMQYCARMINPRMNTGETDYEILGDDIVIFSKELADKYLEVMSLIGVPINETKSVVSAHKPVVEFAKRTGGYQELSPIPFKQFMSQDTFKGRINTVIALFKKDKSFLNRPFAVLNTVLSKNLGDTRPHRDSIALLALMNSYFEKSFNVSYFLKFVRTTEPMVTKGKMLFANFSFEVTRNILSLLLKDRKLPVQTKDGGYLLFEFAVKETIRCRLISMFEKYTDTGVEHQILAHNRTMLAELPRSKTIQLNQLCRQFLMLNKINYLTSGNLDILNDPKIPIQVLLDLLVSKMNDLSGYSFVDRLNLPSTKLPAVEIDTCSILRLVAKGFSQEAKYSKDPTTFDIGRFISFVRKETNYKDLSKLKGFSILDEYKM